MDHKELLLKELENASEPVLIEVLDFLRFLKAKSAENELSSYLLSEDLLAKDWLRPEEEEAWSDL